MQRRDFLVRIIAGSLLSLLGYGRRVFGATATGTAPASESAAVRSAATASGILSGPIEVLRPDDLLSLRFEFSNLSIHLSGGGRIVRGQKNQFAYIAVIFPPQHLAEPVLGKTAPTLLAGESRLVFSLPKGVDSLPFTLDTLLSWGAWSANLAPLAMERPPVPLGVTPAGLTPAKPKRWETAIEVPYRLILSPNELAGWSHALAPVKRKTPLYLTETRGARASARIGEEARTELWHTRLGWRRPASVTGLVGLSLLPRTVRAIWSPDYERITARGVECGGPGDYSLTPGERNQIVHLSSRRDLNYSRPTRANQLMLSGLGAWLDVRGDWIYGKGEPFTLLSWIHRATLGRDQFVRVVCRGNVMPFGHRVAEIRITERRIANGVAALHVDKFVVVRQQVVDYPKPEGTEWRAQEGRMFPFRSVRLKTLITPELDEDFDEANPEKSWIRVDKKDFQFQIEAEDWEGQCCEFSVPLMFVPGDVAERTRDTDYGDDAKEFSGYCFHYLSQNPTERCKRPFHGQTLAFAPRSERGDTSYETTTVTFSVLCRHGFFGPAARDMAVGELWFAPIMQAADVRLAAASHVAGADTSVGIEYFSTYVNEGFGGNNAQGQIFAQVPKAKSLYISGDQAGGVIAPTLNIRGLSRKFGVVYGPGNVPGSNPQWMDDLKDLATGVYPRDVDTEDPNDPTKSFFGRYLNDAKLLGGIALAEIITKDIGDGKNLPTLQTRPNIGAAGLPTSIETKLSWTPKVESNDVFRHYANTSLTIDTTVVTYLNGNPPTRTTFGALRNFTLDLFGYVKVNFVEFSFRSLAGEKPDFNVVLDANKKPIEFTGPLMFLNALDKLIDAADFSDPPSLEVTPGGALLAYSRKLPDIGVGAITLQNLALSAGLNLPFDGRDIEMRLAFAERNNPCTVSYLLLGGGAYFGITVGSGGLHLVEGAIEFGGNLSLDLVVAKGHGHLMVGILFSMTTTKSSTTVSMGGYVRAGGALEVLGLVEICIEFSLSIVYVELTNEGVASGTIQVEVDVAFFSVTVDVSFEKRFAGSTAALDGGPAFAAVPATLDDGAVSDAAFERYLNQYCAAFAQDARSVA